MCAEVQYWSRCANYPRCWRLNAEHKVLINCTLGLPVEKPFGTCGFGVDRRDETMEDMGGGGSGYRVECGRCEEQVRDRRVAGYWWSRNWYR